VRQVLATLAALGVLGTALFLGWQWLEEGTAEEPEPRAAAAATVEAYLEAWEAGDHVAMALLVRDPPDGFARTHAQLVEALEPDRIELRAGEVVEVVEGRATAPVTIRLLGEELGGEVTWDVEVVLERSRGEWSIVWDHTAVHPDLAPGLVFDTETEPVDRSPILAADGTVLAGTGQLVTFGFEPTAVTDPEAVVEVFEDALPGSGATAERLLGRDDLVDGWFYPVVTVSAERAELAAPTLRRASGVLRRTQEGRAMYADDFALHVVGRVAEATAEQLEELGEPYTAGDHVGQFGLERHFEGDLIGSDLVRIVLRDGPTGGVRHVVSEHQADPSGPVRTTIDVTVQQAIENTLVTVGLPAAIVAVDAETGAILGSASRPLSGYNRAFEGRYPPGSTFKIVTLEALLADGASANDEVECPGQTLVGGLAIRNAGDRDLGTVDLLTAFAESCNTTFARLGAELGADELAAAAERFGFGAEPLSPLAAFGGSFPAPQDTAELGAAAFGQARVEVSPLHLAAVAAAARSGVWHQPYLLADDGPGESRPLSVGVLDLLRTMMRAVVAEGTGTAAEVTGTSFEVHGKTGTAQGPGGVEHAWFAGSWGDVGFAVLVEEGGAGGEVAAPIAARFVDELAGLVEGRPQPTDDDPADEDDGPDEEGDGGDG
jgi:cell division protein FtsI/penicillin-binding protein 2